MDSTSELEGPSEKAMPHMVVAASQVQLVRLSQAVASRVRVRLPSAATLNVVKQVWQGSRKLQHAGSSRRSSSPSLAPFRSRIASGTRVSSLCPSPLGFA